MWLLRRILSRTPARGRWSAGSVIAVLATLSLLGSALAAALLVRDRGGSNAGASVAGGPSNSAPAAPPGGTTPAGTATPGVITPAGSGSATAVTANPATPVPPATPPPRTPAPSSTPVPPGTLTLTEADAGRSITVHRGETIVVQLHAMQAYIWSVPRSSNQAVVAQRSGTQSTNGDASGSFSAVATGTADLSATENPRCYPQCLPPSRYWSVHITVIS